MQEREIANAAAKEQGLSVNTYHIAKKMSIKAICRGRVCVL